MKIEGALTKRFFRHDGIYRSDVSSLLFTPGPWSRFPVGPAPGYRASRKEHALPIVRDEFRPAIPRRVARQHCPSPLHRHFQHKSYPPSAERIYHRTVDSVLTVCLTKRGNPHVYLDAYEKYIENAWNGEGAGRNDSFDLDHLVYVRPCDNSQVFVTEDQKLRDLATRSLPNRILDLAGFRRAIA